MTSKELIQKKNELVAEARKLNDIRLSEKREFTAEEAENIDKIMSDVDGLDAQIESATAEEKRSNFFSKSEEWLSQSQGRKTDNIQPTNSPVSLKNDYQMSCFRKYLVHNRVGLTNAEYRALAQDSDTVGGYLNSPAAWSERLLQDVDNEVFVRRYANITKLSQSDTQGFPVLATDIEDPTWTTEVASVDEDTAMLFGVRNLVPKQLSKRIKVSRKLLHINNNVENLVRTRLAYKFATAMENAYLNGAGVTEPLGIFQESASGITSDRNSIVHSGSVVDGILEACYDLKSQHMAQARLLLHRTVAAKLRVSTDGNGRYLWVDNQVAGQPATFNGIPVDLSEYCPHTWDNGEFIGALCNWKCYEIADLMDVQIERLNELYAENSQVGVIGWLYTDGAPAIANGFVRLVLQVGS